MLGLSAVSAEIFLAHAQGPQPSEILKKQGLLRVKGLPSHWVLDDEAMVLRKFGTTKSIVMQLEAAQKTLRELTTGHQDSGEFISYCQMQMDFLDQRINAMDLEHANQGPTGGIPAAVQWHNVQVEERNAMVAEYNRLRAIVRSARTERGQIQQINEQLASELEHVKRSYTKSVGELRELVDAILKDYDKIGKKEEVVQALSDLSKSSKTRQKLGPSKELQAAIKWLERSEKSGVQRQQRPKPGRGRQ
jgi:hypothetical protein